MATVEIIGYPRLRNALTRELTRRMLAAGLSV